MSVESQEPERRTVYFHPEKIIFHVTGEASDSISQEIVSKANEFAQNQGLDIEISEPRTQIFPATSSYDPKSQQGLSSSEKPDRGGNGTRKPFDGQGAFSLVYADVKNLYANVENIYANDSDTEGDEKLLGFITSLDEKRYEVLGESIQVVFPSWLTSGSPRPGGTGGPGGIPFPYNGLSNNTDYKFDFGQEISPRLRTHLKQGSGEGVVVAILDTAPYPKSWPDDNNAMPEDFMSVSDQAEWEYIYDEWVDQRPDPHSLIDTLLDPDDRHLTIYSDPRVMESGFRDLTCIDHDYEMNDHGLFVAGIIHSLAPRADLHLFQVLTHYGIGDLEIIGDALSKVINEFGEGPLVVNLSLNFDIPLEKNHIRAGRNKVVDPIGEKIMEYKSRPGDEKWLDRIAKPYEAICDILFALNSQVIAAAGNDFDDVKPGSPRPQARFPAAFDRAVGVGALPKSKMRPTAANPLVGSSYSNLADRPPKNGLTTLGGEVGEGNGILGIYLGEFPSSNSNQAAPPNKSGWAWWCGTSFATPIISGLTAQVLSHMIAGGQQASTEQAIQELYDAEAFETIASEDVLFATQG